MEMRDRERGTVFWSFGYPENIDQTHQLLNSMITINKKYIENITRGHHQERYPSDNLHLIFLYQHIVILL